MNVSQRIRKEEEGNRLDGGGEVVVVVGWRVGGWWCYNNKSGVEMSGECAGWSTRSLYEYILSSREASSTLE